MKSNTLWGGTWLRKKITVIYQVISIFCCNLRKPLGSHVLLQRESVKRGSARIIQAKIPALPEIAEVFWCERKVCQCCILKSICAMDNCLRGVCMCAFNIDTTKENKEVDFTWFRKFRSWPSPRHGMFGWITLVRRLQNPMFRTIFAPQVIATSLDLLRTF